MVRKNGSDAAYEMGQGVELIRQGLFAFMVEVGVAYKLILDTYQEHEKCHLKEMDLYGERDGMWFTIKKNISLRQSITVAMYRFREHGIQARENNIYYTKRPTCSGSSASFLSVGLIDVKPAFLFLAWGILVAAIVLVLEVMIFYGMKWKMRNSNHGNIYGLPFE